jgi:uncharacterized Ntn-hydrolase superfamily protein
MRKLILFNLALAGCAAAPPGGEVVRPLHTYSIVARDPKTGELGVAVESHWFSVGSLVPWAEAGVGAVATQSFVEPSYGPKGLELMKKGVPAAAALAQLVKADAGEARRQVAMVDGSGRAAAHTGSSCIDFASHKVGEGYSVQANMMLNGEVVPAMALAYESAKGPLAERLIAALWAAQKAGGDIRGQQSAALLVVKGHPVAQPWEGVEVSLRVEDHPEPLRELKRLFEVHRAYERMNAGDAALAGGDPRRAMEEYEASTALAPGNVEVSFWAALALANRGQLDEARPLFRHVFAQDPNWKELVRRLPKAGVISTDEKGKKLLEEILKVSP